MGIEVLLPLTVARSHRPQLHRDLDRAKVSVGSETVVSSGERVDRSGVLRLQGPAAGGCHLKIWTGSSYRVTSEHVKADADLTADYRTEFSVEAGVLKLQVFRRDVDCIASHTATEYKWFHTVHRNVKTIGMVWHLVHTWQGRDLSINMTYPSILWLEAALGNKDRIILHSLNGVPLLSR